MNELLLIASKIHLLTIAFPSFSYTCWSGPPRGYQPEDNDVWNGWDAPAGANESFDEWRAEWKKKQHTGGLLSIDDIQSGKLHAGYGVRGWPPDWKGMQAGFAGVAPPPPWSYVPKNVGKPSKCYDPPDAGHCKGSQVSIRPNVVRYGYSPYTDECRAFQYSGCGGNLNNFASKLRCEQDCINPVGGCATDSDTPLEDIKG